MSHSGNKQAHPLNWVPAALMALALQVARRFPPAQPRRMQSLNAITAPVPKQHTCQWQTGGGCCLLQRRQLACARTLALVRAQVQHPVLEGRVAGESHMRGVSGKQAGRSSRQAGRHRHPHLRWQHLASPSPSPSSLHHNPHPSQGQPSGCQADKPAGKPASRQAACRQIGR